MNKLKTIGIRSGIAVGTVAAVIAGSAAFSAFEAHIINVTATIENALSVDSTPIHFGTVFPQQHLDKPLVVALSRSFLDEDNVNNVEYFIRQKPKCGITSEDGTVLDESSTLTGHIVPTPDDPATQGIDESVNGTAYTIDCGPKPELQAGQTFGVLPSLCPYLSKEADLQPANDTSVASFHVPFQVVGGVVQFTDAIGLLDKDAGDEVDNWTIDLAVPTFTGQSAQDWADFVHGINPDADPTQFTLNPADEHKVFGCDLWVEVSNVSLTELD